MNAPGTLAAQRSDLVNVLAGAATIAQHFWHFDDFDIYECVKRSSYVREIPETYMSAVRAARHCVAGGDLGAYNDAEGRTRRQIADVLANAAARALDTRRAAFPVSGAVHRRRGPVNGADTARLAVHSAPAPAPAPAPVAVAVYHDIEMPECAQPQQLDMFDEYAHLMIHQVKVAS